MSRKKDMMGSKDYLRMIRTNIEKNAARADYQWAKEHKRTEAPPEVKRYHRKMFENAEYEKDRRK